MRPWPYLPFKNYFIFEKITMYIQLRLFLKVMFMWTVSRETPIHVSHIVDIMVVFDLAP